jgi:hypothetical protein
MMMMRPRTVTAISTLGLCVLALVTPATAIEIDGREFVVLANKRIGMESGNTFVDLNVGVNDPAGALDIGASVRIAGGAIASRISAATGASIDVCEFNTKMGPGTCLDSTTPAALPLTAWPPPELPIGPLPPCVDDPSTPNVTVVAGGTVHLPPGCYRAVTVLTGGTLTLEAGTYDMQDLQLETEAAVEGLGSAESCVSSKKAITGKLAVIIAGVRLQTPLGMPNGTTSAVISVGKDSLIVDALLYAPFGKVHLHGGTSLIRSPGSLAEVVANTIHLCTVLFQQFDPS